MTALLQRDESAIAYRPSDVLGRIDGNEVVIAIDDERRERRLFELGQQTVPLRRLPFFRTRWCQSEMDCSASSR
jgi:hypothetical protein